jgi:hypothetical protein
VTTAAVNQKEEEGEWEALKAPADEGGREGSCEQGTLQGLHKPSPGVQALAAVDGRFDRRGGEMRKCHGPMRSSGWLVSKNSQGLEFLSNHFLRF